MTRIRRGCRRWSITLAATSAAALFSLTLHSTLAANATWNGSTDGSWPYGPNWTPSSVPGSSGLVTNTDTALFNSAGNGNTSIAVDSGRNLEDITFDTAACAPYTFSGGTLVGTAGGEIQMTSTVANTQTFNMTLAVQTSFTLANNSASPTAALNYNGSVNTGSLTLSGSSTASNSVGGSTGTISSTLIKTGSGTWTIAGTSAASIVYQGTLELTGSATSGSADGGAFLN